MRSREKSIEIIKWGLVTIFFLTAVIALTLPQLSQAANKPMPTALIVLDDVDQKNTQFAGDFGKVPFDHEQHVAKDKCVTCHHTNAETLTKALEQEVPKCTTCHLENDTDENQVEGTAEGKTFKGKPAMNSKDAFHGNSSILGCVGCHQERSIEPTSCKACHTEKTTIEYKYKGK